MNPTLQVILIVCSIVFLTTIYRLVIKNRLEVKYSIWWMIVAMVYFTFAIFPSIPLELSHLLRIADVVSFVFWLSIAMLLLMCFVLNTIISRQNSTLKNLVQEISMLKKQVGDLLEKDKEE